MHRLSYILRLVALAAAFFSILIYFAARGSLTEQAAEIRKAERANQAIVEELDRAVVTIQELEVQIKSERAALAEAKQALSKTESALQSSEQQASMQAAKLRRAEQTILGQTNELAELRDKLLNAERKKSNASKAREIELLTASIDALSKKNKALQEALDHERARRTSLENSLKQPTRPKGRLLDPNYKPAPGEVSATTQIASIHRNNQIIVFSALPVLELEPGHEVRIIKNGNALGKVRVFKITDSYTVANLLEDFDSQDLDAGSIVTIIK
jgi:predicted  nucleic acid-binding Zn-ribbon protein